MPAGEQVVVEVRTSNQGTLAAGRSTTRGLLSADDVLDDEDVLLAGSDAVPALAVDVTHLAHVFLTISADTAPGSYRLFVCSDYDDAVAETDETDNCSFPVGVTVSTLTASPTVPGCIKGADEWHVDKRRRSGTSLRRLGPSSLQWWQPHSL